MMDKEIEAKLGGWSRMARGAKALCLPLWGRSRTREVPSRAGVAVLLADSSSKLKYLFTHPISSGYAVISGRFVPPARAIIYSGFWAATSLGQVCTGPGFQ